MYGFFKKSKSLLKMCYITFSVLKISPGGQNQVLLGIKKECCLGSKLSASTQSQCLCGCTQFWPLVHSIWTPDSTPFWLPAELIFEPRGLFLNLRKAINHNFKRDLAFLKKTIHLTIFPRFYGKKLFLKLGISLSFLRVYGMYWMYESNQRYIQKPYNWLCSM